jgi:hypothetical protein
MDDSDLQEEYEREENERRAVIYGNNEARRIVNDVFTKAGMPVEAWGEVHFAVLERVDTALENGTPREDIPALAERWLRDEVKRSQS